MEIVVGVELDLVLEAPNIVPGSLSEIVFSLVFDIVISDLLPS